MSHPETSPAGTDQEFQLLLHWSIELLEDPSSPVEDTVAHLEILFDLVSADPGMSGAVRSRFRDLEPERLLHLTSMQHLTLVGPDVLATLLATGVDESTSEQALLEATLDPHVTLAQALERVTSAPPSSP